MGQRSTEARAQGAVLCALMDVDFSDKCLTQMGKRRGSRKPVTTLGFRVYSLAAFASSGRCCCSKEITDVKTQPTPCGLPLPPLHLSHHSPASLRSPPSPRCAPTGVQRHQATPPPPAGPRQAATPAPSHFPHLPHLSHLPMPRRVPPHFPCQSLKARCQQPLTRPRHQQPPLPEQVGSPPTVPPASGPYDRPAQQH